MTRTETGAPTVPVTRTVCEALETKAGLEATPEIEIIGGAGGLAFSVFCEPLFVAGLRKGWVTRVMPSENVTETVAPTSSSPETPPAGMRPIGTANTRWIDVDRKSQRFTDIEVVEVDFQDIESAIVRE